MTEVIKRDFPDQDFSSITLVKNSLMPPQRDVYNSKIWEELQQGDRFHENFQEKEANGKVYPGQLHFLDKPVKINPLRWHAAERGGEGDRILLVANSHPIERVRIRSIWPQVRQWFCEAAGC